MAFTIIVLLSPQSRQQTPVHIVCSRQTATATSILRALLAAAGKDIRTKADGVSFNFSAFLHIETNTHWFNKKSNNLMHKLIKFRKKIQIFINNYALYIDNKMRADWCGLVFATRVYIEKLSARVYSTQQPCCLRKRKT